MLFTYATFVEVVTKILLVLGIVAGVVCAIDWAIRARKISPFSGIARFFRRAIDPMIRPVEAKIVRFGGQPASAPLWVFLGVIVAGIVIIQLLGVIGGLMMQISVGLSSPTEFVLMLIGWAFRFVTFALIVRVISSWLPVSPSSKWVRWSYVTTEWLLAPLRRVIPPLGAIDVTPIVAYILLMVVAGILHV
jgi:YggT family protein